MNQPEESISLFPLNPRCALLTNFVWTPNAGGEPSLDRQKLWVRFPGPVRASGLSARTSQPVGRVRIETAEDDSGLRWRTLAEVDFKESSPAVTWPPIDLTNIRVNVVEAASPSFPHAYVFLAIDLTVRAGDSGRWAVAPAAVASKALTDRSPDVVEPFAGKPGIAPNEQLGLAHGKPQTDRLEATACEDGIAFESPVFRMAFSRKHARVTQLGWDTNNGARRRDNLLSTANTRGAFPVVVRDGRRLSSESCGGSVEIAGRTVVYRGIRPIPEIEWEITFMLGERGFSAEFGWKCSKKFYSSEIAALRIPFDLYRSVTNVLAMPDTTGPSGLVSLPLVINAPNHGVMRVTARAGGDAMAARILPLRTHAELWLDIIPGAVPLENGIFEIPAGQGRATLDFELTKIFPLGTVDQSNVFGWWELPPFYSFADRETVLGAMNNAWLNGLAFRPDLGRFANNSVADSVAMCANFYAEIAAYSPELAPGLDPRKFIRIAADQMFRDHNSSIYSNWRHFPTAATVALDCAWLYVASSGDWDWARRRREVIVAYVDVLRSLEYQGSGLIASEQSGIPEEAENSVPPGNMQCHWADSMRSGHLESYVNAHAYRSLNRAADLLERLDSPGPAAAARGQAERLRARFTETFYDSASGQIIQWIAKNGRRFGFQSHMHLGAAIALGLVEGDLARELLGAYLARLSASGFDRYEWGLPILLDPIPSVCHNEWKGKGVEEDGSDLVGVYQNGSIHTHQTWYLLQALYKVGMRHEANDLFMKMTPLVRNGGLCGGLHSGIDWRHPVDGRASGYEGLLAEQYHFLLAAITGYLGCELTIDGLVINGPKTARIRDLRPNFARMAGKIP